MLRVRPVRGTCFVQGGRGSNRCERLVPTLHGQARLRTELTQAVRVRGSFFLSGCQEPWNTFGVKCRRHARFDGPRQIK